MFKNTNPKERNEMTKRLSHKIRDVMKDASKALKNLNSEFEGNYGEVISQYRYIADDWSWTKWRAYHPDYN